MYVDSNVFILLKDGVSVMMWAAVNGDEQAVRMFLDSGADVNHKSKVSHLIGNTI